MIIAAKFASVCPCCNVRIAVGSKVEWAKGSKARHVTCSGPSVATATPRATSDYDLAERGLVRVSGPRGSYVRRASRQELEDELGL